MRVAMDTDNSVNNIKCIFSQLHTYKNTLIKVCIKFPCNVTNKKDVIRIVYELLNHPSYNVAMISEWISDMKMLNVMVIYIMPGVVIYKPL